MPHKIIKIREIMGSTGTFSPVKRGSSLISERKPHANTIIKRRKVTVHRTEPDDIL